MSKKNKLSHKVAEVNAPHEGRIPRGVTHVKSESTDHFPPTFSFDFTDDNRFLLHEAGKEYLKGLTKTLKTMCSLTWDQIKQHKGLQMKRITTRFALPRSVSPDIELLEFRVSEKGRLHGFRVDAVLQILWFDPDHEVCPEGKIRR